MQTQFKCYVDDHFQLRRVKLVNRFTIHVYASGDSSLVL